MQTCGPHPTDQKIPLWLEQAFLWTMPVSLPVLSLLTALALCAVCWIALPCLCLREWLCKEPIHAS